MTNSLLDPGLLQQIRDIVRRDLKLPADEPVPEDMPFFGGNVDLDSLDMLLLLTSIERQFGVRIPNETIGKEVFQNLASLANYIQRQRAAGNECAQDRLAGKTAARAGVPVHFASGRGPAR